MCTETVNSIHVRPLQHRLFRHLVDKTDAHYGDLTLHTLVHWLSRGKLLFRLQAFLHEGLDLPTQLRHSQRLPNLPFLLGLNNIELHTELQDEKKKERKKKERERL
jgi:hypothetical protein